MGGVHIHHFVFGMVGLLLLAYLWLLLFGSEDKPPRHWFRLTAFAYGVCSALILDEFALWLNLRDVYWQRQGRESVEALAIFAGVLLWARPHLAVRARGLASPPRTSAGTGPARKSGETDRWKPRR